MMATRNVKKKSRMNIHPRLHLGSLKWILLITVFAGFVLSALFIFTQNSFEWSLFGQQKSPSHGFPARLVIPTIKVDASIQSVGLTLAGAMDAPKGPADVAWFNLGPLPGEKGNAVIAGHYGYKNSSAAFDNLDQLSEGDRLLVQDEKGEAVVFVVRELRSYGETDDTTSIFSSDDGAAHLILITCEGVWSATKKSYSGRLVVFADKEQPL